MRKSIVFAMACLFLFRAVTVFAADPIGTVVSLKGKASATAQDGKARDLELKSPIMLNDKVKTEADASMQIMFLDDSVISQGEKSEMTVDEYVYDPKEKSKNNCLIEMNKGVFRAVTAKITALNPDRFKVRTRFATIGIRGCEIGFNISERGENVLVLSLPKGQSIVVNLNAGLDTSAFSSGGTVTKEQAIEIIHAGTQVRIEENGGTSQRFISPQEAINFVEELTSPGTSGMSEDSPTGAPDGESMPDSGDTLLNVAAEAANEQGNQTSLEGTSEDTVAQLEQQQAGTGTVAPVETTPAPAAPAAPTLQYTQMGTGVGWEWGVWAYPATAPDSVAFKAPNILPDMSVMGLFSTGYSLTPGAGQTAAALVKYSGSTYLVSGPVDITVSIPAAAAPGTWTVSSAGPLTDGANTQFQLTISGTVDNNTGQLTGTLPYIMNSLTVAGVPLGDADMTPGGTATANIIGSGAPAGIIGNFQCTFQSGAAVVQGGFAGN